MQELQDQLGSLAVTADDKLDPAREIQQLRRISTEPDALGNTVVPTRKTHAFLKALPDKHHGSLKTVVLCEKPRDGRAALDFDDVANRATAYHAMQIHGKVSTNDDGSGSDGRALNTVVHGGTREVRRQGGRGQGRGRRGNGDRTSNGSNSSNSTTATVASTRTETHTEAAALEARKVYAGEVAATKPPVKLEDGAMILAKTTGDVAGTLATLPSMGGTTAPSASRMRLRMPRNRQMSCRSLLHDSRGSS